jgi:hypothetical protein
MHFCTAWSILWLWPQQKVPTYSTLQLPLVKVFVIVHWYEVDCPERMSKSMMRFRVRCNYGNMLYINSWYDNIRCNFFRTSVESVLFEGTKQYVCTDLYQNYYTLWYSFLSTKKIWKLKILCYIKDTFQLNNRIQRLSTACTSCVNYDILLSKLEFYIGRGKINDLIKS